MANPDLVVRVAANIEALKAEMAAASATVKSTTATIETFGHTAGVEMKGATTATEGWSSMLGTASGVLSTLGISLSAGALVSFAKEVFAAADELTKLHDTTGISVEGLQRFQVAGDDAGNSIDELTSAVVKMEDKLVSGDKSAAGALAKLGLSFADLKGFTPENQFIAISDAIRLIPDPAERVNVAIDLFGKQGANVLPTLVRGFDDLKGATVGMSKETIKALDDAGDAFGKLWRAAKGGGGEALGAFWKAFTLAPVTDSLDDATAAANKAAPAFKGLAVPGLPEDLAALERELTADAHATMAFNTAMLELDAAGKGWFRTLETIDGETVEAIKYYLDAGVSQSSLATAYGLTAFQIKAVSTAMAEELAMAKVLADFTKTAAAHQDVLDAKAMKGVADKIVANQQASEAAAKFNADFLKGALDSALAQDKLNATVGQLPETIKTIPPTLSAAEQAFESFKGVVVAGTMEMEHALSNAELLQAQFNRGEFFMLGFSSAPAGAAASLNNSGHRASGGPVSAGQSYTVGERGPETLTMGASSGFITPHGGGGLTVNLTVNGSVLTEHALVQAVKAGIMADAMSQGFRF